ncbi:MAG: DUF2470 domain-containing protein [Verrucomicrobiota bacterium]
MATTAKLSPEQSALHEYEELLKDYKSVMVGSVSASGVPEVSYTPAIHTANRDFFIYVSEMSAHTQNIREQKTASLMVIEDEKTAKQLFARKRVTFQCEAEEIERDSEPWKAAMVEFETELGGVVRALMGMADFHLIRLRPSEGRLVVGFGRAFDVTGENLDVVEHVKGIDGKGHKMIKKNAEPLSPEVVQRMVNHMNEDHSDAVLLYVKHFAQREADSASLEDITHESMKIKVDNGEELEIPFRKPLADSHDAHMTMVKMAKQARKAVEAELV